MVVGRTAMVTGASSGLGRHFAQLLAREGAAELVLIGRREEELANTATQCRALGAQVITAALDLRSGEAIQRVFDMLGDQRITIDLLVNNAGIAPQRPAIDVEVDEFDDVIATNLRAAFLCARQAAAAMRKGGDIVNIASILGLRVAGGLSAYAAAKAGWCS